MSSSTSKRLLDPDLAHPIRSCPGFIWWGIGESTNGSLLFYLWMFVLTAVALVGANAWAVQVADGMIVTHMTDHVSWGLYIANFTFMAGVAAGGVMMVIPAYLYHDKKMHDVVIVGEILAIAAIVMCLLFVTVDLDSYRHGVLVLRTGRTSVLKHRVACASFPRQRVCRRTVIDPDQSGNPQKICG